MDLGTMRSMNIEGIDILSYYKITDTEPITRYTNGPIKIGIGETSPITGLSKEYDNELRIGFMLENEWEGKITKITDLIIYLPKGIKLDDDNCNGEFEKDESITKLGEEEVNVYRLKETAKNLDKMKDKEKISFNCKTKVSKDSISDVLGESPITTKYLRVTAEYDFKLEKTKTIQVKRPEGFTVRITPTEPAKDENLQCIGTHDKKRIETATYRFYKVKEDGEDEEIKNGQAVKADNERKTYKGNLISSDADLKKGDKVYCKMTAKIQGIDKEETVTSGKITIQDSLPEFEKELTLTEENGNLKCWGKAKDADGDKISEASYQFFKGNELVKDGFVENCANNECIITIENSFKEGDKIKCVMAPYTNKEISGDKKESNVLTISEKDE